MSLVRHFHVFPIPSVKIYSSQQHYCNTSATQSRCPHASQHQPGHRKPHLHHRAFSRTHAPAPTPVPRVFRTLHLCSFDATLTMLMDVVASRALRMLFRNVLVEQTSCLRDMSHHDGWIAFRDRRHVDEHASRRRVEGGISQPAIHAERPCFQNPG